MKYIHKKQANVKTFIKESVPNKLHTLFIQELKKWDNFFTTVDNASSYDEDLLIMLLEQAKENLND